MVLKYAPLFLLAACSQSLFDNNGGKDGGNTGGEIPVASSCTAPCIGDAAADFDGTPTGKTTRWRYLDDKRDRTWAAMTSDGAGGFTGAGSNKITSCAIASTEAACTLLPGALLLSSTGATGTADPAIELTMPANQVNTVSLKVAVPAGAGEQTVRLYRNSREDTLYTFTAQPGVLLETAVPIDALDKDRILFALAPTAGGVDNVGIQLYVSGTGEAFPKACQIALSFAAAAGTNVDNLCGGDFSFNDYNMPTPITPVLGAGPFAEQGMAADLTPDHYYKGENLTLRNEDTTTQLWVKQDVLDTTYAAWLFSDLDLDATGGLGIAIYDQSGPQLDVQTCTGAGNPLTFTEDHTPYPNDHAWHFVRIVQKGGVVNVCLDGQKKFSLAIPAGKLTSTFKPHIGRNVVWTPAGAFLDGGIDDVRVFTGALPCE